MSEEKESTRVMAWEASICSPLRMCQPVPASPSSLVESAPQLKPTSSATKSRSVIDGRVNGNQAGEAPCSFDGGGTGPSERRPRLSEPSTTWEESGSNQIPAFLMLPEGERNQCRSGAEDYEWVVRYPMPTRMWCRTVSEKLTATVNPSMA